MAGQAVDANRHRHRCPTRRYFLKDLQIDLVRLTSAAPFLRLRQAQQPSVTKYPKDADGITLVGFVPVNNRVENPISQRSREFD